MSLVITLIIGLVLLAVGGDVLVRGAVAVAQRLGVSPLLIGLTLVGFGTSTPELVTSLQAALIGSPGIAVGNVVGSNIANILLILGVAAVMSPFAVAARTFRRDGAAVVIAALALVAVCLLGVVGPVTGLVFLAALAAYLLVSVRQDRAAVAGGPAPTEEPASKPLSVPVSLLLVAGGIVATVSGARLLVAGASELARGLGVSDTVIGLTIVAVGTSLPELVTSVTAALKKQGDIAFGNVLGSNVFNVLFILGATSLVTPIAVPGEIVAVDVWVMLAATLALAWVAVTGWRVTRTEGAALLAGYAAYLGWLAYSSF